MKIISFIRNSLISLYSSLKRFPTAIVLAISATILLIVLSHDELGLSSDTRDILGRIVMVIALGIPVSLITKLIFERNENISTFKKAAIYLSEACALVLYYFFLLKEFEMVPVTRYIALSVSFYLGFIFVPYFFRRNGFELYVIKLLTRFFVTIIYSAVLFLGISAILFTIDKLLGADFTYRVYRDVWFVIAGIFAPCFFLAGVPQYEDQLDSSNYPKLLNVLLQYIVMPLITVYTAILYIYFAKIIILLQWPVGMVAHLVLWYSVISAIVIFLVTPLNDKSSWVKSFIFILPKLIIPLIIMMFISIGIRVKAYGITENRYFVIALGLWALGIMIYLNLVKTRRNMILTVTLSTIAFLSVIGPWSSYSISKLSQNNRFESILLKYGMVKNSEIVKSGKAVSDADKKEIGQILNYFSQNHKLGDVRYIPEGFKMEQMEKVFGFPNSEYYNDYRNDEHFSYISDIANEPIDIHGYSSMFSIRSYNSSVISLSNNMEVSYDNKKHELRIDFGGREIYKTSILEFAKKIYEKYGADNKNNIDPVELSFTGENENIRVKIIFYNIYGFGDKSTGEIKVESMEFYVLIGER